MEIRLGNWNILHRIGAGKLLSGLWQRAKSGRRKLDTILGLGVTRLGLAVVSLAVGGAILVLFFESQEGGLYRDIWDGIYWAVVTMTTVGYGDIVPKSPAGRVVAMALMVSGMGLLSLLTATIASGFVAQSIKEARGLGTVSIKGHIIICGWNQNAERIIQGIRDAWGSIVRPLVLVNQLPEESVNEILYKYRDWDVHFIRGDFSQESCLERANIREAESAIILAESSIGTSSQVDQHTVLATLTMKHLNPQVRVCAQVLNPESEAHLRRAEADEVVVDGEYDSFLLSGAAATPGVVEAVRTLLTYGSGSQLRRASIPSQYVGSTFKELFDYFQTHHQALLVGVVSEEEGVSLQDVLGADYTAIDEFISRKFKEAGREFDEAGRVRVSINPGSDYRVSEADWALVIGKAPIRGR
ncbi:MAG: Ion transport 2 domain protein [Dehalococcoidia bacterium]|nr:Ion transport 2 domain protein [Dehalococcoidia bacterium]